MVRISQRSFYDSSGEVWLKSVFSTKCIPISDTVHSARDIITMETDNSIGAGSGEGAGSIAVRSNLC